MYKVPQRAGDHAGGLVGILNRIGRRRRVRSNNLAVPARPRAANGQPEPPLTPTSAVSPPPDEQDEVAQAIPIGLRIAAGWAWRVIAIVIMTYGIGWLMRYLSEVTVPIAVAILLTALITPVANFFDRRAAPRALSVALAMIIGLALVGGTLTLISVQIASQAVGIGERVAKGFTDVTNWLASGPLPIPDRYLRIEELTNQVTTFLTDSSSTIAGFAADFGTQLGHFLAGVAIALFATFYFLYDGRSIWSFLLKLVPRSGRDRLDDAARTGWNSLVHYVRATILVAFSDAVGVLVVALILQVPGAPALAALVFLGAFVPLIGALVSGFVAVFFALVMLGWVEALIMLAGIILVMQLEGHVLQPFLLGRAVKLHPLAVLLGIAIGVVVGGIVGALMSIPLLAFAKAFIQHLVTRKPPIPKVATGTSYSAEPSA
jgi:predicted PurR-regulated permease PerM